MHQIWRRHIKLVGNPEPSDQIIYAWEDVKAMFNGGSRKRAMTSTLHSFTKNQEHHHHSPSKDGPTTHRMKSKNNFHENKDANNKDDDDEDIECDVDSFNDKEDEEEEEEDEEKREYPLILSNNRSTSFSHVNSVGHSFTHQQYQVHTPIESSANSSPPPPTAAAAAAESSPMNDMVDSNRNGIIKNFLFDRYPNACFNSAQFDLQPLTTTTTTKSSSSSVNRKAPTTIPSSSSHCKLFDYDHQHQSPASRLVQDKINQRWPNSIPSNDYIYSNSHTFNENRSIIVPSTTNQSAESVITMTNPAILSTLLSTGNYNSGQDSYAPIRPNDNNLTMAPSDNLAEIMWKACMASNVRATLPYANFFWPSLPSRTFMDSDSGQNRQNSRLFPPPPPPPATAQQSCCPNYLGRMISEFGQAPNKEFNSPPSHFESFKNAFHRNVDSFIPFKPTDSNHFMFDHRTSQDLYGKHYEGENSQSNNNSSTTNATKRKSSTQEIDSNVKKNSKKNKRSFLAVSTLVSTQPQDNQLRDLIDLSRNIVKSTVQQCKEDDGGKVKDNQSNGHSESKIHNPIDFSANGHNDIVQVTDSDPTTSSTKLTGQNS
ncbi:hypothetical protein BLA29_002896 [Euroglyphus maynei]|uniref:Uncharacterized protein n=1 Tax=Euroglyphus maynei TaxID=6958 RepID=A0A1Y3B1V3_EURMA|nr:hypothetical protein BLA29_002896 [Euroglyphus maynei]